MPKERHRQTDKVVIKEVLSETKEEMNRENLERIRKSLNYCLQHNTFQNEQKKLKKIPM